MRLRERTASLSPREPVSQTHSSTKRKNRTRFCIRIYYLKGSLKVKILYSIMDSFFFVSVNTTVLVVGARGSGSASPRGGSHTEWPGQAPRTDVLLLQARSAREGDGLRVCLRWDGNAQAISQVSQD